MLESSRLRINKSYQSLRGVDTVTAPEKPKSVRTIVMPAFLRGGEALRERSESTEGLDGGLAKEVRLGCSLGRAERVFAAVDRAGDEVLPGVRRAC